ncbi:hypothetical protein LTS18_008837, partial [Coniosporium uncinatum]
YKEYVTRSQENRVRPPLPQGLTLEFIRQLQVAFWSGVQLESDIYAELGDLPRTEITELETDVHYPGANSEADSDMLFYYYAQVVLRKQLNAVSSSLYTQDANQGRTGRPSWYGSSKVDGRFASIHWENLQAWRNGLPGHLKWENGDPPATNINAARLRGKYYGAAYIITRPFLYHAVEHMEERYKFTFESPQLKQLPRVNLKLPSVDHGERRPPTREEAEKAEEIIMAARICVESAMESTVAFDGVNPGGRWIVTNIHGTAQAQFGNLLVLAAVRSSWLRDLVNWDRLEALMKRTIKLMENLSPISPTARVNLK